jgi:hypothetical protein
MERLEAAGDAFCDPLRAAEPAVAAYDEDVHRRAGNIAPAKCSSAPARRCHVNVSARARIASVRAA